MAIHRSRLDARVCSVPQGCTPSRVELCCSHGPGALCDVHSFLRHLKCGIRPPPQLMMLWGDRSAAVSSWEGRAGSCTTKGCTTLGALCYRGTVHRPSQVLSLQVKQLLVDMAQPPQALYEMNSGHPSAPVGIMAFLLSPLIAQPRRAAPRLFGWFS